MEFHWSGVHEPGMTQEDLSLGKHVLPTPRSLAARRGQTFMMRLPLLALAIGSVSLPCVKGFVQSSFVASYGGSASSGLRNSRSSISNSRNPASEPTVTRALNNAVLMMSDRLSVSPELRTVEPVLVSEGLRRTARGEARV